MHSKPLMNANRTEANGDQKVQLKPSAAESAEFDDQTMGNLQNQMDAIKAMIQQQQTMIQWLQTENHQLTQKQEATARELQERCVGS